MFETFSIIDTVGPTTLVLNSDIYPFTVQCDTHCEMSDRPRTPKQQLPGQFPVYTYARNRIWHIEGDIIGADMAAYDVNRLALLAIIMPPASPTQRYTGIIETVDGAGTVYQSEVTLTSYSVPVVPLYPGVGTYMFEWESDDPFVYTPSIGGTPVFI
jgi:hypothetical protein